MRRIASIDLLLCKRRAKTTMIMSNVTSANPSKHHRSGRLPRQRDGKPRQNLQRASQSHGYQPWLPLSDPATQDLAQTIGMVALDTARWHGAKSDQVTCDVRHVAAVLQWAVESSRGINVLVQEQRAELAAAVHKAACDLAATRLDAGTCGSLQYVICARRW